MHILCCPYYVVPRNIPPPAHSNFCIFVIQAVLDKLPPLNWSVLRYLSNFLRELSLTSHVRFKPMQ